MANILRTFSIATIFISLLGGLASLYMYQLDANNISNLFFQIILGASAVIFVAGIGLAFMSKKKPDPFEEAKKALLDEEAPQAQPSPAPQVQTETNSDEVPQITPEQMQYFMGPMQSNPELVAKVVGDKIRENEPPKELSFEEQMALDKKRYYDSLLPPSSKPLPTIDPATVKFQEPPKEFVERYQQLKQPKQSLGQKVAGLFAKKLSEKGGDKGRVFSHGTSSAPSRPSNVVPGTAAINPPRALSAVVPSAPQEKVRIKIEWPFKKKEDKLRNLLDNEDKQRALEETASWKRYPRGN